MKPLFPALLFAATLRALAQSGQLIDLQVESRQGEPYAEYHHRGSSWIAGEQGVPYQLTVHNKTSQRVLVVVSVDGVNVLNGKTAAVGQDGYVLDPWETATIAGWRKSLDDVAQFYFTSLPDSYAARTGRPGDVGVIGAAVFRERYEPPPPPALSVAPAPRALADSSHAERNTTSAAPAKAAAPAGAPQAPLGTGHGAIEHSAVEETTFERASREPSEVLQVRYDSRHNLMLAGILPRPHPIYRLPRPFPADGFVPDPPRNPG